MPDATTTLTQPPSTATTTAPPPGTRLAVPAPLDPHAAPERRRSLGGVRTTDVYAILGALAASVSVTTLLWTQLTPFSGLFGAVLVTYAGFLGFYALLVSFDERGPAVVDRVVATVVHSLAAVLLTALVCIVVFTSVRGFSALLHLNFFTQDLTDAGPLEPLTVGGITHAVVGTLIQISIALAITVPLGVACAVYLNEIPGRFARLVRTVAEAMTALPSIIAGLFIYATFILALGFPKSGLAAALAISVMMLPIIIRASDVVLRLVPGSLKEASLAMGTGQWRTVWHVTLPTARSGLATAVILGAARGIGETSPVLITAGYTASMNTNPFEGPMVSLPLAIFEQVKNPQAAPVARGFGTAVVLLVLVLILFVIARLIGGRGPGNLSARQLRRRMSGSRRDAERMSRRAAPAPATPAAHAPEEPS